MGSRPLSVPLSVCAPYIPLTFAFGRAQTITASGIGGGGFMIIDPGNGSDAAFLDFREMAPAAAFREMYIGNLQVTVIRPLQHALSTRPHPARLADTTPPHTPCRHDPTPPAVSTRPHPHALSTLPPSSQNAFSFLHFNSWPRRVVSRPVCRASSAAWSSPTSSTAARCRGRRSLRRRLVRGTALSTVAAVD